jgi:hypothetical protein
MLFTSKLIPYLRPGSEADYISISTGAGTKLCIDDFITFSASAHFFAIIQALHLDANGVQTFAAQQHHIGPRYGCFAFHDAPLPVLGGRSGVALNNIDILHKNTVLLAFDFQDLPNLAFIFSGDDLYLVISFYMDFVS